MTTIILYDQEGRPGKWAFSPAPKIDIVAKFLLANAKTLAARNDVSIRRASVGKSGKKAADCSASAIDIAFGTSPPAAKIKRLAAALTADGHQDAPAIALERAVKDLKARGGGRILYFSDTVTTCGDDPLWVAQQTGPDVAIDVVAIGPVNKVHSLSELALASGGKFYLINDEKDIGKLGGPLIDEVLSESAGSGAMEEGDLPAAELPQQAANNGGNTANANLDGPLFSSRRTGVSFAKINTGIKECPAFDKLTKNLLNFSNGKVDKEKAPPLGDPVAIAFILDASGSMAARQGGQSKMQIAKDALGAAVLGLDGTNATASLTAYGFDTSLAKTAAASCPNTEVIVPFGKNQGRRIARTAARLTAYGYTPLAASLRAAGANLQAVTASRRIAVLISDGEETCGGDPVAEARALAAAGIGVNTYVVGYDLDAKQKKQLQSVARAGGTNYLNAADGRALVRILKDIVNVAVEKTERIAPSCENPIRGGLTPDEATLLPPGIYTVGEVLKRGEYRYYRVATKEGERGLIRSLIQSRQYSISDKGAKENAYAPTAMTTRILYPDGRPTGAQAARGAGIPGTSFDTSFVDTVGNGFVFGIGDNYRILSPDSLFQVSILPFADNNSGDAGDDPGGSDIAEIGPDNTGAGHFGNGDSGDVWRYDPGADTRFTVALILSGGTPRYRISVFDETSGKRIGRKNNGAVSVNANGPVRILVENRAPKLRPVIAAYKITVTND